MNPLLSLLWFLFDNAEAVCLSCCACWGMTFCIAMLFLTTLVTWRHKG